MLSDALYIFALHATETADFPSLIICHNVIDGKAFSCHRKANVSLYCIELNKVPY